MHFTAAALLSLVAINFAGPIARPQSLSGITTRQVEAEAASMSGPDGNVVAFDAAAVIKSSTDAGI